VINVASFYVTDAIPALHGFSLTHDNSNPRMKSYESWS